MQLFEVKYKLSSLAYLDQDYDLPLAILVSDWFSSLIHFAKLKEKLKCNMRDSNTNSYQVNDSSKSSREDGKCMEAVRFGRL